MGDVGATLEVQGPQVKEGLMALKGDHDVWKQWRDEFRANVIL